MPSSIDHKEPLQRLNKLMNSYLSRPDSGPFREPVDFRGLELYDYPTVCPNPMDLGTVKRNLERNRFATVAECAVNIRQVWQNCMTYNENGSDFWLLAKAYSRRFEDKYRKIKGEFDLPDSESEEEEDDDVEEDEEDDDEEEEEEMEFEDDAVETSTTTAVADTRRQSGGASATTTTTTSNNNNGITTTSSSSNNTNNNSSRPVLLLDKKATIASNLLLLTGPQLGHVVTLLERKCPAALISLLGNTSIPGKLEIDLDAVGDADANDDANDANDANNGSTSLLDELSEYTTLQTAGRKRGNPAHVLDDITSKRKRKK